MNTQLRENVDWVGYVDWNVRDFHSYRTGRGTTYNAYLIRDARIALVDTVKAPFAERLLERVSALTDPAGIDYVVCNHAEPDHSGSLPAVLDAARGAVVVCDKKCAATLSMYYDTSSWRFQLVKSGDRVPLGNRTLQFLETPMVHWPESMFTYLPEEKLLFSMDAFGQHLATSGRFDDENSLCEVMDEAKTYYANIVMPFSKPVTACMKAAAGLEVDLIAPSHGVVWRSRARDIVAAYEHWAAGQPEPKVVVLYDSMWGSTDAMAEAILAGAARPGITTQLIHVRRSSLTRIATEMLDAAGVAVGSPTINTQMMPSMAGVLSYLTGLRPPRKAGFAFGSYGWGRGGPELIDQWMRDAKWDVVREPLRAQYRPSPEVLDQCRAAGELLAEQAIGRTSARNIAAGADPDP